MKKTITIYELLGKVKDDKDTNIYVKYINRMTEKEDKMWSCVENIIDKLDNKVVYLNDEVEIISDEEEFEDIYNFCWNENYLFSNRQTGMTKEDRRLLDSNFKDIHDTINKLIKNQKILIEKLNKEN